MHYGVIQYFRLWARAYARSFSDTLESGRTTMCCPSFTHVGWQWELAACSYDVAEQ